jgi:hypothetical protein
MITSYRRVIHRDINPKIAREKIGPAQVSPEYILLSRKAHHKQQIISVREIES